MYISPSSINNFLRCRRLYHYANQLRFESTEFKPAFFLGSGVHDALQHWYQGEVPDPAEWFLEWSAKETVRLRENDSTYDLSKVFDLTDLGYQMLAGYVTEYGSNPAEDAQGVRMIAKEREFKVAIPGVVDGYLVGRVDGVCWDRDDRLWVFESKTYSQAPGRHDMNLQTLAYTWAFNQPEGQELLESLGVKSGTRVSGSLYNGLRKQRPSGRVSTPLFLREWVHRSRNELDLFAEQLREIYLEMAQPRMRVYPTLSRECQWCQYSDPCYAAQVGADEQWILDTKFVRKQRRGDEQPTKEA